ncbi:hypothetical protein HPB51_016691 [Rhipicephalus microplus]|uniref:CCHC-type domain-containing protein n=1 Tax=Rhipicephalus microplus TaxID=6941 RepID=A0A9J6D5P0_RHIMP|nr:hypothetical protein HPB51_016691 [Rhipicephalus microplus]
MEVKIAETSKKPSEAESIVITDSHFNQRWTSGAAEAARSICHYADPSKRPYRIEDYREPPEEAGVLKDRHYAEDSLGAFPHLWRALRKALSELSEVKDVRLDEWRVPGFEFAESTTRVVRMVLNEGVLVEKLPHLFKFYNGSVLVVVPGRTPVCLGCRRRGHIRRDCQTPRCTGCRAFGHVREGCARTYASVIGASPTRNDSHENIIDADEAETTAPMAKDCSPQRGPSGQPERSESSLTEPEVTNEETIEDQNAVEQQECGDYRGCDLSKDSVAPTKRPRTDTTLPREKASDCKQQRRERPSPKAGGLKGNTYAMSRSASSSPARGEWRRK